MKNVRIKKDIPAYITDFGKVLSGKAFDNKTYLYSVKVDRFTVYTSGSHTIVQTGNNLNELRSKYGSDLPIIKVK